MSAENLLNATSATAAFNHTRTPGDNPNRRNAQSRPFNRPCTTN